MNYIDNEDSSYDSDQQVEDDFADSATQIVFWGFVLAVACVTVLFFVV